MHVDTRACMSATYIIVRGGKKEILVKGAFVELSSSKILVRYNVVFSGNQCLEFKFFFFW